MVTSVQKNEALSPSLHISLFTWNLQLSCICPPRKRCQPREFPSKKNQISPSSSTVSVILTKCVRLFLQNLLKAPQRKESTVASFVNGSSNVSTHSSKWRPPNPPTKYSSTRILHRSSNNIQQHMVLAFGFHREEHNHCKKISQEKTEPRSGTTSRAFHDTAPAIVPFRPPSGFGGSKPSASWLSRLSAGCFGEDSLAFPPVPAENICGPS